MCGIFGYTTWDKNISNKKIDRISKKLFLYSESRGKEASGFAILKKNKAIIFKRALPANRLIKENLFKKNINNDFYPFSFIGHARLVTNGKLEINDNNQPVTKNGVIIVHNGIIVNSNELWQKNKQLVRTSDVDTEIITALIKKYLNSGLLLPQTINRLYQKIEGTASIAFYSANQPILALATNNGSLYKYQDTKQIIFSSEKYILEKITKYIPDFTDKSHITQIKPHNLCLIDISRRKIYEQKFGEKLNIKIVPYRKKLFIEDISPENKNAEKQTKTNKKILHTNYHNFLPDTAKINSIKRCARCILPSTMPFIKFDDKGVCNYCLNYSKIKLIGSSNLEKKLNKYRSNNNKYDCLFPLSGGRDSSYGLHLIKTKYKMSPVAYSYDWGMITDLGRRNQARMCAKLGIEHIIISADIAKKRKFIKKNVLAWLKKPDLGTIPLFMAGDKKYFYYIKKLLKKMELPLVVYSENQLEKTDFKTGFCGIHPKFEINNLYDYDILSKLQLAFYYLKSFAKNQAFLNSSILDTIFAYFSSYFISHEYIYLFKYEKWDERKINDTLINEYNWELDPDTKTTWRIGDGTAAFYNYIYYTIAGFTENDTFRSNQIREGMISRDEALRLAERDNQPRFQSIKWYCDTIGIDFEKTLKTINQIKKIY